MVNRGVDVYTNYLGSFDVFIFVNSVVIFVFY